MPGSTARVIVTRPLQLVSIMVSQSSSDGLVRRLEAQRQAGVVDQHVDGCQAGGSAAIASMIDDLLVTSRSTGSRADAEFGCQASQASLRRPAGDHLVPATNLRAIAAPKPAVAPVMKTIIVCPCERKEVDQIVVEACDRRAVAAPPICARAFALV